MFNANGLVLALANFQCWRVQPNAPDGHQARRSELLEALDNDPGASGFALFPGEQVSQTYGLTIDGLHSGAPGRGIIWLMAAVRYNFAGMVGRTTLVLWVMKRDPTSASVDVITGTDSQIPASQLTLTRMGLHEIAE